MRGRTAHANKEKSPCHNGWQSSPDLGRPHTVNDDIKGLIYRSFGKITSSSSRKENHGGIYRGTCYSEAAGLPIETREMIDFED